MLKFLPAPVIGVIAFLLIAFNTVFWVTLFIPVILLKLLIAVPRFRQRCSRALTVLASRWVDGNSIILRITQEMQWDIETPEELDPRASYLVISNHRSWTDIFVLQHIFRGKIPFLKFFLKSGLIWVPFLGLAWWALDFPFMKRHSRQFLEKHPELRGQDLATTRKHCEKFKKSPVSVINFVEGTRFSANKHRSQASPFRNLLRPRAGGVAFVLAAMGDTLSGILDVTTVYPDNDPQALIWQLLQGKIPRIVVRVRLLPVPPEVVGRDYFTDSDFRTRVQEWINRIWQDKDMWIGGILPIHRIGTEALEMQLEVLEDGAAVARRGAEIIAAAAGRAVAARGGFILAVSGGRNPWEMFRLLAGEKLPWEKIHVVQVDERVAPAGHPDRNFTHLRESLLDRCPLRPDHIHAMPVEAPDLETAAQRYAHLLRKIAGAPPVLDLAHLGLGPDGHTASLVPGDPVLDIAGEDVALTGLYQGRRRMTLTFPILNRSRSILWVVTGKEKAEMLARMRDGDRSIPAGCIRPENAIVLADRRAAALPKS